LLTDNIRRDIGNALITLNRLVMLKKTLLPLSLGESRHGLRDMAEFLKSLGTESVCLCHIFENQSSGKRNKRALSSLEDIADIFREYEFHVETVTANGSIASEICRQAVNQNVDYISVLWKRKNVIKRSILSSPDIDLLRICNFTTLIFKTRRYLANDPGLEAILYATDCKEADKRVLPYLTQIPFGVSRLLILHVRDRAPDPETDKKRSIMMQEKIDDLAKKCRDNYTEVKTLLEVGSTRSEIARSARKQNAGLVVIGRNEKRKPMDKILGSTAEVLPYRVRSSILIVT